MKLRKVLYAAIMMATIMFMPRPSIAQNLEVVGQAKITIMPTDDTADQIVVKQADGTLAVRSASSLSKTGAPSPGGTPRATHETTPPTLSPARRTSSTRSIMRSAAWGSGQRMMLGDPSGRFSI